jgi:hypothetical protein
MQNAHMPVEAYADVCTPHFADGSYTELLDHQIFT